MVWGDKKIREIMLKGGNVVPPNPEMVNPASLNLCIGNTFQKIHTRQGIINLGERVMYETTMLEEDDFFTIYPGEFVLATTKENVTIPDNAVAFVQGRSSIGRIGLTVQNAGYVDPGFKGQITLELVNESDVPINLIIGYPVAQLVFMDCDEVEEPYHGKYLHQLGATGSMMHLDREKYSNLKGSGTND